MTNEERQRHIDRLRRVLNLSSNTDLIAALTVAISALERERQMKSQSPQSPYLEAVRRLIEALSCSPEADDVEYDLILAEAEQALPSLRSLLAEVERLREENAKLKEQLKREQEYVHLD